ncbi:transcriptional regulator [Aliidongia dinghuensis]|uniref:Transcriptional regulator n=1 Tax=Aliidongia dinghuensis TaxID=1867774 RepID=A0A8J2YZP2_9PROT|nr:winged helix-turn-helix domain-containing protein [Aliidongia dinghuensis]GGF41314.1 transcriptional regulator [Aliidongia dinghuensis]
MGAQENVATVAFLIADRGRAAMLMALADGRARPASTLAEIAGITAQTASSHLAKLLDGGLVAVETAGRHRFYRLAGPHVAHALEALATVGGATAGGASGGGAAPARKRVVTLQQRQLCFARCCYDHLAGRVAVAITRGMLDRGFIAPADEQRFAVTGIGAEWFGRLGIDVTALKARRWGLARQCLDWSEQAPHLAGPLGVELMRRLSSDGWLRRRETSRAIEVTPKGWIGLRRELGLSELAVER